MFTLGPMLARLLASDKSPEPMRRVAPRHMVYRDYSTVSGSSHSPHLPIYGPPLGATIALQLDWIILPVNTSDHNGLG